MTPVEGGGMEIIMKQKKKIIVVGAYGCGNKGDDAILDGFISLLSCQYELIPTCGHYGKIEQLFEDKVDVLSCRMNEGITMGVLMNLVCFFPRYISKLRKADAVIIGGGSLIHDLTKYNLPFFSVVKFLAKLQKKKVFFVGVGAGPLTTVRGQKQVKRLLNTSDGCVVRDPIDCKLLSDIGVKNVIESVDVAFAGRNGKIDDDLLCKYNIQKGDYIVVTACQWFKSEDFWNRNNINLNNKKNKLANSIKQIMMITGKKVVFLPTVYHDFLLGKDIEKVINDNRFMVLDDQLNCRKMAFIVENSYFLFGMRMHSIIFAIRSGVPFIATIYDNKVVNLIKRVGMEEYIITFEDSDSDVMKQLIEQLENSYKIISNHLLEVSQLFKNNIQKNIIKITDKI